MEQAVLFWIFVAIFTATAVITLLGITNVIKINQNFLTALFSALILEVIAAVILVFNSFNFNEEEKPIHFREILHQAGLMGPINTRDTASFIAQKIKENQSLSPLQNEKDSLNEELDALMEKLKACEGTSTAIANELNELEKTFYIKIKRLRDLINGYGGFINIAFQEDDKKDVYGMLVEIFKDLSMITNQTPIYKDEAQSQINYTTVRNMYRAFKKKNGQKIKDPNYVYITEFDTILMIRQYLSIISPVK